jgi:hypothetical protein
MCKLCAKPVDGLSKNSGREYILCATSTAKTKACGENSGLSTKSTQLDTRAFSTQFTSHTPLLNRRFSTLYTWPINTITTYINK